MIKFDPKEHRYFSPETSEVYTSVTTFLKSLEQPKDWDNIAEKYAKKNGNTAEYWREQWKKKGEISADRGTKVHSIFENLYYTEPQKSKVFIHDEKDGIKNSFSLKDLEPGIYPELMIYSQRFKLAGQSDLVIINPDKTFEIEDYKTDKVINFESGKFYNPKKKMNVKSMYCYPVSHLDECNWNKYQLQLSIYAYMLEQYGFKNTSLQINHVECERDEDGIIKLDPSNLPLISSVTKHKCEYLKSEVISILKTIN